MPSALSIETQVDRLRVEVGCESRGDFIAIARVLGAQISAAEYSRAMNDQKVLDQKIWERLLEVVTRMRELQDSIGGIPVAWSKTSAVVNALTTRLVANITTELNLVQRDELVEMAEAATTRTR